MGTVAGYRMNVFQLSSTMTVAKPVVELERATPPITGCVVRYADSIWALRTETHNVSWFAA